MNTLIVAAHSEANEVKLLVFCRKPLIGHMFMFGYVVSDLATRWILPAPCSIFLRVDEISVIHKLLVPRGIESRTSWATY